MILSGDDLTTISAPRLTMLKKLQPPTGKAARFADVHMEVGEVDLDGGRRAYCLLNWNDQPQELSFSLSRESRVSELWSDEDLGLKRGRLSIAMPPRSGKVLICRA
jgi:alpha-galactosidase